MTSPPPLLVAFTEDNWSARVHHTPLTQATPGLQIAGYVKNPTEEKVSEPYPKPAPAADEQSPSKTWPNITAMLRDTTISIVCVTNAISERFGLVKSALAAGKHVIVRASPAETSAQMVELIQLSKDTGKLLSPFFCHRYDGDYNTIAALLKYEKDVQLGEWKEVTSSFACKLAEGSEWLDVGSHIFDQVLHKHLWGLPKSVEAKRETGLVATRLRYAEGFEICVNWGEKFREERPATKRFRVEAARGSFEKDPQLVQLSKGMSPMDPEFGIEPEDRYGTLKVISEHGEVLTGIYPTIRTPTQRGLYVDFLSAIRGERDVPCSAEDARDALLVLEAVAKSLFEGSRVHLE